MFVAKMLPIKDESKKGFKTPEDAYIYAFDMVTKQTNEPRNGPNWVILTEKEIKADDLNNISTISDDYIIKKVKSKWFKRKGGRKATIV